MCDIFRVAIEDKNQNQEGYIEYDSVNKSIKVILDDEVKRLAVEGYLKRPHVINVPNQTLMDFKEITIHAGDSLESFKLALTRMWTETDVVVEWSRPV